MPRKRMTLPKKKEDLEKIVEEVEETHHHEHEHHHHHHGDLEDTVTVLELLVDSLGANVRNIDNRTTRLAEDLARLYRILSYIVEAISTQNEDEKRRILQKALNELKQN